MGTSGDWTIDMGNAPEIAQSLLGDLGMDAIREVTICSPEMLDSLIDHAEIAGNEAMRGFIGGVAYMGALVSEMEKSMLDDGIHTSHNIRRPSQYLRVAARVFPELEPLYQANYDYEHRPAEKPAGVFSRLLSGVFSR